MAPREQLARQAQQISTVDSAPRAEDTSDSVAGLARRHGIGETTIWREIKEGRLRAHKVGKRTIIRASDESAWLRSLERIAPGYPDSSRGRV